MTNASVKEWRMQNSPEQLFCLMMKFYSTVRVGINDVPVPTYRTIMKKEHAMGFHSLDPLTDAFGMQK